MIIEEITIRNWRGYREPHTFRFDEGFNLLVGNNEAGKSTLFEAFTRALFDRHNSRAEPIRQIQPLESSLGPEAVIVFQAGGKRYKVRKRFLQRPVAEVFTWRKDRWELDHEGDAADDAVRDILRGENPGRAAQPEHRGLCQALWYLQDEPPLPDEAWAEGVNEGLAGIVSLVAKSPEEDRILREIEDMYNKIYTPKDGKIRARSDLALIQGEIQNLEIELQALHDRSRRVESLRLELQSFAEERRQKDIVLRNARAEVADLRQRLKEGTTLEEGKREKEEALRQAEATRRRLADDLAAVDERIRQIDELNRDLEERQQEADTHLADARIEERAADGHHKAWKMDHEPELRRVAKDLEILQAIERVGRFEEEEARISGELERIETAETGLRERQDILSTTPLPGEEDLRTYQAQKLKLATVSGRIEQTAIRIGFDLRLEDVSITADPDVERLTEDGEYLILEPTTFTIGDLGTITVRGGGSSLEDLQGEARSLSAGIASTFERFGVADEQDLYDLRQHRQSLEQEIEHLKGTLDDLTASKSPDNLREDLVLTRQKITGERGRLSAAPPGWQDLADDAIREKSEELARRRDELNEEIERERKKEEDARAAHARAYRRADEASTRLTELRTEVRGLERANGEVLKSYGAYENLQAALERETESVRRVEEEFEDLLSEYRVKVEGPRVQYDGAQETLRGLEEQMQSVEREIVDRKARIEEAVSRDLYSNMGDLEARLGVRRRRLDQATRQAEAVKLLHDMMQAFKKKQATALSEPVADLMNRWLVMLTSGSYDSIRMNEKIFPEGVLDPDYDEEVPLDYLSYGTREQVIVLLRLAMGVLLSGEERNLVIIDDCLVNADPIRMRHLCQILDEVAAKHCQIIIATCNATPYAGLQGEVIRVPGDGVTADRDT